MSEADDVELLSTVKEAIHELWVAYSKTGEQMFLDGLRSLYRAEEDYERLRPSDWIDQFSGELKFASDILDTREPA